MRHTLYERIKNDFIKSFQSTDNVTVEYNDDVSGCTFCGGGLEIKLIVNNVTLKTYFELGECSILCGENDTWEMACQDLLENEIEGPFYNDTDEDAIEDENIIEEAINILTAYFKLSLHKFKKIADQKNYDLDAFVSFS